MIPRPDPRPCCGGRRLLFTIRLYLCLFLCISIFCLPFSLSLFLPVSFSPCLFFSLSPFLSVSFSLWLFFSLPLFFPVFFLSFSYSLYFFLSVSFSILSFSPFLFSILPFSFVLFLSFFLSYNFCCHFFLPFSIFSPLFLSDTTLDLFRCAITFFKKNLRVDSNWRSAW